MTAFLQVIVIGILIILIGYMAVRVWSSAFFRSWKDFLLERKKLGDKHE